MVKKIIVANWKMNPETLLEARKIISSVSISVPRGIEVVFCPPSIFFSSLSFLKYKLGIQNIFHEERGAYTGEVSAKMARNLGAEFVICGHSERRHFGETNENVSKKVQATLKENMSPILCVGEKERDAQGGYLNFLKEQIEGSLVGVSKTSIKNVIVAYEPVWAIGKTGKDAMNADILHQASIFVRKVLVDRFGPAARKVRIIYGGSVAPENACEIIKKGEVEGLLVGHQSLNPQNFLEILRAVVRN